MIPTVTVKTNGASAMSIWARYNGLERRQRVLLGVMCCFGGVLGLWFDKNTQVIPTSWLPKPEHDAAAQARASSAGARRPE